MMKALKRVLLAVMAAIVALCVVAVPAHAEDQYTYTVRIFAGNNGLVNGQEVYVLPKQYAYGENCVLDTSWVKVNDGSKYYVKGFRESGQDDLHNPNFDVTGDTDLVVAYGVQGEMVSYTIHFVVQATGQELGSATFTGKVGDKPVESYEYFEGYRPLYRNITGTLKEGTNDWTLPYVAVEAPGETVTVETTTTTTGAAAAGGAAAAAAPAAEGAAAAAPGAEGAAAAPGAEGAAAATPEAAAPATEEILDVDTPLAGPDGTGTNGTGTNGSGTNGTETIGGEGTPLANAASAVGNNALVILAVAALALLAFLLLRRHGGDETEQQ